MDDIIKRLDEQDRKLDAIYASAERTRKYLLWTLIITVAVIILPLIGLAFAIPSFLSIYTGMGSSESVGAGQHPHLVAQQAAVGRVVGQVRNGLAAGGRRIRTLGPPR